MKSIAKFISTYINNLKTDFRCICWNVKYAFYDRTRDDSINILSMFGWSVIRLTDPNGSEFFVVRKCGLRKAREIGSQWYDTILSGWAENSDIESIAHMASQKARLVGSTEEMKVLEKAMERKQQLSFGMVCTDISATDLLLV